MQFNETYMTNSMTNHIFDQLNTIGFSGALIQTVAKLLPRVNRRFTISERHRYGDKELKFVGLLYFNKERQLMPLRYCHIIDVSESYFYGLPTGMTPDIKFFDEKLQLIDFNSPCFVFTPEVGKTKDYATIAKAYRIYDALTPLDEHNSHKLLLMHMLKEKYITDTMFGQLKLIQDGTIKRYDPYFPNLTLTNETGFLHMDEGAKLFLEKQITNLNTVEEKKSALRSFNIIRKPNAPRIIDGTAPAKGKSKRH